MSVEAHKYVYGVVRASTPAPARAGIGGMALETVAAGATAAIVSDVVADDLQAGREELVVHAHVLEDALASGVVLPMRFGAVMADADAVRRDLLERHHDVLESQLAELEGKVELRLRAIFDETALMREVVRDNPEIAAMRDALRGQDDDATYYERIRLGEMVAAAVERACQAAERELLDALRPLALAVDSRGVGHERMAFNGSFLVERDRLAQFDEAVDRIGREQADRMHLKYTGPLPPHSFVELTDARAPDEAATWAS